MRFIIMAFLLFIFRIGFGQAAQTLYFDPSSAIGAPQSRVFEKISYIPLETTKQSLLGQISMLAVTSTYFIVYDYDTEGLYFFGKTGKFIKKYKNDKYRISGMQFIEKENALYLLQVNKKFRPTQQEIDEMVQNPFSKSKYGQFVVYNLADIEKEDIKPIPEFTIAMANPFYISPNRWAYSIVAEDKNAKDSIDYELKISDGKKTLMSYFPYKKRNSSYLSNPVRIEFFETGLPGTLFFTRMYNYSVYRLTADSVSVVYNFVLPFENTIPKTFFTKEFSNGNELRDYKMTNTAYAWKIDNVVPFNNYLFFSLDYQKRDRRFLFDKNSNRFYSINRISPDSTNAYLPVMGWNIQYYDSSALYSSISSDAMFRSKDDQQYKNPVYSSAVKSYFENSKPSSNPVIIILKPFTTNK